MLRIIILLITIFTLNGCYTAPDFMKPMAWLFKQMPDDAPNVYKRGWIDGCQSGIGNMTNPLLKDYYPYKQDAKLRSHPLYYKTWKDTYSFCRHYTYGTLRLGGQRMNLQNEKPSFLDSFMGTKSLLSSGMLNLWGPGGNTLLPFKNVGPIAGSGEWPLGIGGISGIDYSDQMIMNGKGKNPIMNWDF